MNLIFETDIGRDPDDMFALLYMIKAGVDIRCITISPGDEDQVAITKAILNTLGLKIPVGVGKLNREGKTSSGGVHYDVLHMLKHPLKAKHDGYGPDIIESTVKLYPDCELFVCGPLNSVGEYLKRNPTAKFDKATTQGGFLPYNLHNHDCIKLDKFVGKDSVETFNLNGDKNGAELFLKADIKSRRFVSKNVCHTVVYDKEVHRKFKSNGDYFANDAYSLFLIAMNMYLDKHDDKKFHDPCAAVCHLHPEIGTWVKGKLKYEKGKWTTDINNPEDEIIANINYDLFWSYIFSGK
jgi:pyrimidine-specific ribonucleoside hydrolase